MKKTLILTALAVALVSTVALAVDAYSVRQVRDPRALATKLTADFTSVVSTSDAARVTALEATAVTNATAATAITPQAGATVTATAVVTPQAGATVTATAVFTPVGYVPQFIMADGTTNTVSFPTNGTIVVTVANGAGLLTNATAAVTVANGAGLLTNATAVTTMTLQRN